MSLKRRPDDGKTPDDKRRKPPPFSSVVRDVMRLQSLGHLLEPILEPLVRKVVKEEVEAALKRHLTCMKQTCGKELHTTELRNLQLQFENSISLPVFTGGRIEGEDGSNLRISLVDGLTGEVVCTGPESMAKVEIVVLEGDFEEESDIWMPEEFKSNIVREREGKKPLLTGDVILYLKDGVGMVGEISYTDNSSWTRSRRFRLGARVVDNFDGVRIREAKTESFIVRDHRGELYKKHHPPSMSDEVWRLEKIGKDGAFHKRLSREKILTVREFLTLLNLDPAKLRSILGTGMSAKMWEVTVEHARTCVLDTTRHVYFPPNSQQHGVVFNAVGQVTGLLSECEYVTVDKLSETEKVEAQNTVSNALRQGEKYTTFEDEDSLMDGSSHLSNVLHSPSSPKTEGSSANKLLGPQKTGGFNYPQTNASSPDIMSSIYSVGGTSSLDDYCLPSFDNMGLSFPVQVSNSLICDTDSMAHAFSEEDHLQFFDTDLQSHVEADLQSAVDSFMLARSTANGGAQRRWRKVCNVLKWFMVRKRGNQIQVRL
ncbi:calmodulin-binding protein 60 A isoform X1 [Vigna radiata var. radiata]|uniref:Calmodulin-binding protein 60 A isoform X1 n=2 Tax=Vigna radiata var. radiata TaxID=3916 RepID=A0A1S3UU91_VIGRR|nr:calmodulin-binding protein 60 A isoform X1 [Vigna radiata var. radiata]XP_014509654.1 calmodulin-binding protein 60 A isoform X1 [Vigna radiata var. radiata]XP_022639262.1 calmodulin-binding protein 60 A isoform X1 [Vigna radiata var. radiata]